MRALQAAGFDGLLALEVDYIHPAYGDEGAVIPPSLVEMRRMRAELHASLLQDP